MTFNRFLSIIIIEIGILNADESLFNKNIDSENLLSDYADYDFQPCKMKVFDPWLVEQEETPLKIIDAPKANNNKAFQNKSLNPGTWLYAKLKQNYSVDVRPVNVTSRAVEIRLLLKLTQLLDIDEKNQIMTTNVWLRHEWYDSSWTWNPDDYNGIKTLHIPARDIWLPDTVLYNNADGDYQLTINTKVEIRYDGLVKYTPPAIYKSFCAIDVEYFPYDVQTCELKFGPWTYDVSKVDFFIVGPNGNMSDQLEDAVEMSEYLESSEWDLIHAHANRRVFHYPCCEERYVDITYLFRLRRKTLFYTVNLIFPCTLILIMTLLVFFLSCESQQKLVLTTSNLLALNWFILLLSEITPPTSLSFPLIGKYVLFTTVLVAHSIAMSVFVLHAHFQHPFCYDIPKWIRSIFLRFLPRYLFFLPSDIVPISSSNWQRRRSAPPQSFDLFNRMLRMRPTPRPTSRKRLSLFIAKKAQRDAISKALTALEPYLAFKEVHEAIKSIQYIARRYAEATVEEALKAEWRGIARVLDRFFLIIFSSVAIFGAMAILLWAPSLFDQTPAINQ